MLLTLLVLMFVLYFDEHCVIFVQIKLNKKSEPGECKPDAQEHVFIDKHSR